MNKLEISQRSSKRPNGRILIEYLLENGYLEIGKTELIYKFDGKTVIIMLENINIVLELEKVITTVSKKLRRLGINMVG